VRFLAKVTIPLEKADEAFKSGTLPGTMQSAMQRLKPEAAYFFEEDGKRECLFVFNLDVPALLKPLFPNLDAFVHVTPVMNATEFELELGEASAEQPHMGKSDLLTDISPVAPGVPGHRPVQGDWPERAQGASEPDVEVTEKR
jgi:hypothetical protein